MGRDKGTDFSNFVMEISISDNSKMIRLMAGEEWYGKMGTNTTDNLRTICSMGKAYSNTKMEDKKNVLLSKELN